MSYRDLAIDAISKAMAYDPYFPKSEAMVSAWAEALEDAGIDHRDDVLMAVRVMYRQFGDPGWRPTPRVLVTVARECRTIRLRRQQRDAPAIEGPERITFAEYRRRHPDITFPKFGKRIDDD